VTPVPAGNPTGATVTAQPPVQPVAAPATPATTTGLNNESIYPAAPPTIDPNTGLPPVNATGGSANPLSYYWNTSTGSWTPYNTQTQGYLGTQDYDPNIAIPTGNGGYQVAFGGVPGPTLNGQALPPSGTANLMSLLGGPDTTAPTTDASGLSTVPVPMGLSPSALQALINSGALNNTTSTGTTAQPTVTSGVSQTAPAASTSGASGTGVNTTGTIPGNSLLDQTIQGPSINDPVQNALSAWNTFQQASQPQYNADLRTALQQAAAGGALGSGMLNTSLGNIANQYQNQLQTAQQALMENALQQQNQNAYANTAIAQEQQGFQNTQQQEAVQNALNEWLAGSSTNPANMNLDLSGLYGNEATQAGNALSGLISGTQNANSAQNTNALLAALLGNLSGTANNTGGINWGAIP
jgi:hypothetical protein